ncbi:MAG: hypothetical protein ISS72_10565 [Candidatus Brocadiae bacterium]|nr:hypothetical protein [Candidatus Brocadiia bacterium]
MDRRAILVAVLLAVAVGAPFLGKAFHIDDTFVLRVSEQILKEPLRPFDTTINWGRGENSIFERTKNPPFLSYYLAPVAALFGYSELALHGAMLVFLVMLAVGAGLLGRWFWVDEWWPMLFVMLSPAVVVSSNVMRDVPAAGLATLGLALFLLGTDEDRRGLIASGAVLVGLASLTKYSSAALIPLLVLYPLLRRKWRTALWALAPLALLGLWSAQNWWAHGVPHIVRLFQQLAAGEQGFSRPWGEKLVAGLAVAGSALFLIPAIVVAWLRRRAWMALPLLVAAGAGAWLGVNAYFGSTSPTARPDLLIRTNGMGTAGRLLDASGDRVLMRIRDNRVIRLPRKRVKEVDHAAGRVVRKGDGHVFVGKILADTKTHVIIQMSGWRKIGPPRGEVARIEKLSWQYYLWATTGAALLAVAVLGGLGTAAWSWAKRQAGGPEWLVLILWAAGVVTFSILITPFQASRHLLPALAPLVVLVLRLLGPRRKAVKIALMVVLVLQAGVAYLVGFADAEFAGSHRRFAAEAAGQYRGKDVWFNGHWGWQQYCERTHGFKHYWSFRGEGPTPPPGAILLDLDGVHHARYPADFAKRLLPLDPPDRPFPAFFPVRTMGGTYSSYYSVTEHRLPYHFTLADTPVDIGHAYRVAEP